MCLFSVFHQLYRSPQKLNPTWYATVSGFLYKCKQMQCLQNCTSNNSPTKQGQEGRLWTSSVHWHFRQKLIQTKFSTDTSPSPISMGTDTALAKTKQELLTQHTLPKTEPMQTSERKLMPVLSLLFHTELLRQSSTSLYHANLGIKTEDSNHQKYRG